MTTTPCPLCGAAAPRRLVRADFNLTGPTPAYQVVRCRACGVGYLCPPPAADELARSYEADYPAHALQWQRGVACSPEQTSVNRRLGRVARKRLALLGRYLPPRPGLRVLDVGCGSGAFLLKMLRRPGVEAWGVDVAEAPLQALGRAESRLRLVAGDLHGADLPDNYFDLVTLWHVLEHDPDPVGVLGRAGRLLRPGGVLAAEVPHSAGLIARLCGRSWLGWDLPRHLVHFTPASLGRAARAAGLARVQVLRQYTLDPLCLSPVLASLALWQRRRRGRRRVGRVRYRNWDGPGDGVLRLVNALERFLGGNGLLLVARAPRKEAS
jgi:SAM-dependent methyltransferase